jgi:hypothetical protein
MSDSDSNNCQLEFGQRDDYSTSTTSDGSPKSQHRTPAFPHRRGVTIILNTVLFEHVLRNKLKSHPAIDTELVWTLVASVLEELK